MLCHLLNVVAFLSNKRLVINNKLHIKSYTATAFTVALLTNLNLLATTRPLI